MFLAVTLVVSVFVSLFAAVVVDNAYQAIAERRWEAVWPLIAFIAIAAGAFYGPPMG